MNWVLLIWERDFLLWIVIQDGVENKGWRCKRSDEKGQTAQDLHLPMFSKAPDLYLQDSMNRQGSASADNEEFHVIIFVSLTFRAKYKLVNWVIPQPHHSHTHTYSHCLPHFFCCFSLFSLWPGLFTPTVQYIITLGEVREDKNVTMCRNHHFFYPTVR